MSEANNQNWGKKGAVLGILLVGFLLFVVLLVYVYNHAQNGHIY